MIATPDESVRSPLKAWVRALERTSAVGRDPSVTLPVLIERLAGRFADAPALIGSEGTLGYRELAAAANRYARWGLARGFAPGDVVCLLMKNCPQYLAIWLGLSRIGATVALINTNLTGEPLAHALGIVAPRHVIVGAELSRALAAVRSRLAAGVGCSAHGPGAHDLPRLDLEVGGLPGEPLRPAERAPPALADRALYIYTSGTTGLPKATSRSTTARVARGRSGGSRPFSRTACRSRSCASTSRRAPRCATRAATACAAPRTRWARRSVRFWTITAPLASRATPIPPPRAARCCARRSPRATPGIAAAI